MAVETKGLRILVVDDDDLIRALLKTLLKHLGADVVGEAANGKEAISQFSTLGPDLVLLDVEMPVKNGFDTLKEIKKLDAQAEIIMLTANDNTAVAESCIHAGARTYIKKGETPQVLQASLQTHLAALNVG